MKDSPEDVPIGFAPVDVQPVIWDVMISLPEQHEVLITRAAEWMVPPSGVDPGEYLAGIMRVFMAGFDPVYGAERVAALPPGTLVRGAVHHRETLLASLDKRMPEREASPR